VEQERAPYMQSLGLVGILVYLNLRFLLGILFYLLGEYLINFMAILTLQNWQ
jgi:hypothetical protein